MCHQHMHLPAVKHSSGALYTHGTVMHCRSAWKIGAFPNLGARQSSGPFQTTGSSFRRKAKVRACLTVSAALYSGSEVTLNHKATMTIYGAD